MKVEVLNIQGQSTGRSVDLPDEIFGVQPNEHAIYLAVKQYNAAQRQGTHKAKERGEIKGSTRKIKRQKGTGTARAGSLKNPLFRGGGRVFGPRPRNYNLDLNKKVKRLARKSALSSKMTDGKIVILEDFTFDQPKTKEYKNILNNLKLADQKTLLVIGDSDKAVYLSSRNIPNANVMRAQDVNTYNLLKAQTVVLSESSVEKIKQTLA